MPSLLSSVIAQSPHNQHLLLLQSSIAQTCLPVLRAIVTRAGEQTRVRTILFCFLYPPSSFLGASAPDPEGDHVRVMDRTGNVPSYDGAESSDGNWVHALKKELIETVHSAPAGALDVIVDSAETLLSDVKSLSETIQLLSELLVLVRARGASSRLIIHTLSPNPLLPILSQTCFSPSLTHLTAHPIALLTHLSTAYLTPPPPLTPPESFWGIFIPIAERHYESEKLVFGADGEGSGRQDFIAEVLVRGSLDGSGRRRGIERVLEGWSSAGGGSCTLQDLDGLKSLWTRKSISNTAPDPTQNLSFNLNLTPEQQRFRAQVPLPYAHDRESAIGHTPAAILYDPDSADDLDDDDPDEDLDI